VLNWIETLVSGAVQGVTEFLPISSDGHLIVTAKIFSLFTGVERSEDDNVFFFVMLHVGTLVAILVHYRKEILAGTRGLLGSINVAEPYRRASVIRVGFLVAASTALLIPDKLFFMKYMKQAYDSPLAIGVGFWITAAALAVTASKLAGGDKGPAETTLLDALLVGFAQAFAPLPGVSRSGLTVAIALALGFRRTWAVQYSLMLAVPAILGAAVFELKKLDRSTLSNDRVAQTIAATVVAGIVGYLAIVWLLRVVRSGRLWYFSVYLVILGLIVMLGLSPSRRNDDASHSPPAGRTSRAKPSRSLDRRVSTLPQRALDRPLATGSRTG
jgi:undecaprenyl-diphosphatase